MQEPMDVSFRNVPRSADLYDIISEKMAQLEKIYSRIIGCRVTFEKEQKGSQPGGLYCIKINALLPRRQVLVKKEARTSGTLTELAALARAAFKVTGYELERIRRREYGHRQAGFEFGIGEQGLSPEGQAFLNRIKEGPDTA